MWLPHIHRVTGMIGVVAVAHSLRYVGHRIDRLGRAGRQPVSGPSDEQVSRSAGRSAVETFEEGVLASVGLTQRLYALFVGLGSPFASTDLPKVAQQGNGNGVVRLCTGRDQFVDVQPCLLLPVSECGESLLVCRCGGMFAVCFLPPTLLPSPVSPVVSAPAPVPTTSPRFVGTRQDLQASSFVGTGRGAPPAAAGPCRGCVANAVPCGEVSADRTERVRRKPEHQLMGAPVRQVEERVEVTLARLRGSAFRPPHS